LQAVQIVSLTPVARLPSCASNRDDTNTTIKGRVMRAAVRCRDSLFNETAKVLRSSIDARIGNTRHILWQCAQKKHDTSGDS
jgi:hypothetical protein